MVSGAFFIHQPKSGCCQSARKYSKQSILCIVMAVITLLKSLLYGKNIDKNLTAQKISVVCSACNDLVFKIPRGNRMSIRREIFTWMADCNESIKEFNDVINLGPKRENFDDVDSFAVGINEFSWNNFCSSHGTSEQYTEMEISIVKLSIELIKCSKDILSASIKVCDWAGDFELYAFEGKRLKNNELTMENYKVNIWEWITNLFEMLQVVGKGVTDLANMLYPPINFLYDEKDSCIKAQLNKQKNDILMVANYICDKDSFQVLKDISELQSETREIFSKICMSVNTLVGKAYFLNKVDIKDDCMINIKY